MNCHDVDRALIELEGSPAAAFPSQAQDHVRSCRRCQELVDALTLPMDEGATLPASLARIERRMVADLRPVRPMAHWSGIFAVFAVVFGSFVAFGVYRMGAFALAIMSPLQAWAILSALAISSGLMAYSLANQMVPGSRHRVPPQLLPGGILIFLTAAIVILFPFQHERDFWARNWGCIRAGGADCRARSRTVLSATAPRGCTLSGDHGRSHRTVSWARFIEHLHSARFLGGVQADHAASDIRDGRSA